MVYFGDEVTVTAVDASGYGQFYTVDHNGQEKTTTLGTLSFVAP